MKKVLSILMAAVMLCGLFAMPVSAEEDIVWSAGSGLFALGANTTRDEEGKVVLDEVGDSFEVVMETDRSGAFEFRGNFFSLNGSHDISTAVEVDGIRMGVCDLASAYVKTEGFSNNIYTANIEAGRHTVRIVNMKGSYAISSIRLVNSGTTAPTTYTTRGHYEYTGTVIKDYRYGCQLNGRNAGGFDLAKNTVIATMGVEEDGLYELSWDIMNYYNGGSAAPDVYNVNVKAGGNVYSNLDAGNADVWIANKDTADAEKMSSDAAYRKQMYGYTTWVNKVLVAQMPLSKGTHQIVIECNEPYSYNCLVDKVYLKKVGEVTRPNAVLYTKYANATKSETATYAVYGNYSLLGAGGWIEFPLTVAYDGMYTTEFTWSGGNASNLANYPRIYVDDVCVWSEMITDTTAKPFPAPSGDSDGVDMVSTLGDIYLPAGNHRIRIMCDAGYMYTNQLVFKYNADNDGAINVELEAFDVEKSNGATVDFGGTGRVLLASDESYMHYGVMAPEAGFYSVGATIAKIDGSSAIEVTANGTKADGVIVGVEGSSYRTVPVDGMLYLTKGINDLTVRVDGMTLVADAIVLTPVEWDLRMISPKKGELYEGEVADANLAKSVKANTQYTAVADIGGAYVNKGVALIVAVYEGGVMKAAYAAEGTAKIGSTIEKTFTTPEAEGNYSVKVFVMDSLSGFKPYTGQTEILPAVAE